MEKNDFMIVRIETEIIGAFEIEKDMKINHYPFEIDIFSEEETNRFLISISKKVINYSSHLPKLIINDNKIKEINFPSQSFLEEQIKILQHIESFGAIDKGIERINWQDFSIEWIPETEEEKLELPIRKYQRDLSYGLEPKILSKDWLLNTVIHKRQLDHLALPLSFFREGANFYHNFQYQNSFINFYLMLEGFFGDGVHYDNKTMKLEFKKSDILEYAIHETIKYLEKLKGKHYEWLINVCKKYDKIVDKDGIIHVLVKQRGNLSHFSLTKSNNQKNPFKDRDYESLAFIAMTICMYASIQLRLEPFRQKTISSYKRS
jgi:hypothetical protein